MTPLPPDGASGADAAAVGAGGPSAAGEAFQRSKTVATWLAALLGTLGIHRLYLHGLRDPWAWLHPLPTAAGLTGVERMLTLGQDDRLAWVLIPLLGLMISQAMLCAIVYGLTPDATWDARFHAGRPLARTGWATVLGVIFALLVGGVVLIGTIAFSGQKFFESQLAADGAR